MRLLIITQKVDKNDDILGFFHDWIKEFGGRVGEVVIVAQYIRQYDLPDNVKVFSLGKEKGFSKLCQLFNFYKLLFKNLSKIDSVFVHMVPMWVVLGGPLFKIYRKKVYLWYTHKSVDFWLKFAEKIVTKIFTASKESCRLESKKIIVTGHGIDTKKFSMINNQFSINSQFSIITAGRIAEVKNLDVLIEVADILKKQSFDFKIQIAGSAILDKDKIYLDKLKNLVKEKQLVEKINFVGSISHNEIHRFYQEGDLFINLSATGSIDKAVLEAMASGLLVLTFNEAFKEILSEQYFTSKNPKEIAEKIITLSESEPDFALREYVVKNHSLENLIPKIIDALR